MRTDYALKLSQSPKEIEEAKNQFFNQLTALFAAKNGQTATRQTRSVKRVSTLRDLHEAKEVDTYLSKGVVEAVENVIDFESPDFSMKKLQSWCCEHYREVGEASPASAYAALTRAGVQQDANMWYENAPREWTNYIKEVSSNKPFEIYPPLHRANLPQRTGAGEPYTQSYPKGLVVTIENFKYMGGESFEMELVEDDQSNQIQNRSQALGEAQATLEEVYVAGRFIGIARLIAGVLIPASIWQGYNSDGTLVQVPFHDNLYGNDSHHGNVPDGAVLSTSTAAGVVSAGSGFVQLTLPALKTGIQKLANATGLNGVKMAVVPDTLVVSTFDYVNADTFVGSEYYPASPSSTTGLAQGVFSKNSQWIRRLVPVGNAFFPNGAWALIQAKKGILFQRRTPMQVVQENPLSGDSFKMDLTQFRSRSRWEVEWIDPRFAFLGNDGSASVSQS
jgi:hypothetical protein